MNFVRSLILFIRGVFSDNGEPSYSRIGSAFALICLMKAVWLIVQKTYVIPDLLNVLYLVGGIYFINRLPDILGAITASKSALAQSVKTTTVEQKTEKTVT